MRAFVLLGAVALVATAVCVCGQAPSPPPIWPASFHARFGLSISLPLQTAVVNSTSYFYYNVNPGVGAQLIDYPDFCPASPKILGGLKSGCQLLFNAQGIYIQQQGIGVQCCMLFEGVGPIPRNFTGGFTWSGTQVAQDYFGTSRDSDYWVGGSWPFQFKYWTELVTHHDVYFHDGGGANWAWDHLNVTTVDPSMFNLFADDATCSQKCGIKDFGMETEEIQAHAAFHAPISLALHHSVLQKAEQINLREDF